jgi:hypothetical protein
VIVMKPQGERIEPGVLALLDDVVLTEVSKSPRFEAIGSSDLNRLLGLVAQQQQAGCDANADACLAEIGGALGARFLMTTTLGRLGTKYIVNMKVIDVARATVMGRRSEETPADEDALAPAVRRMVQSLFPEESGGSVVPWVSLAVGAGAAGFYGLMVKNAFDAGAAGDVSTANTASVRGDVALGVAIVAVATGVGWLLLGGPAGASSEGTNP